MDELLSSALRLATPLTFAALGGVLSERSGVFNIGLEGSLLSGAFGAAAGTALTGSPWVGLITGLGAALVVGLILAVLTVPLGVNQFVSGIAVNLLAVGLTAFFARLMTGESGRTTLPGFGPLGPPSWGEVPLLGPLLFAQDWLVVTSFLLPGALTYLLYRTRWGLQIRAVGENQWAADVAGVPVNRVRFLSVAASCGLAGLGGCHLVLVQVLVFTENMSAGKGFIALAAVILGRWSFWGAFAACLLFGLCESLQLRLQFQNANVPYQLFAILPYALALAALIAFGKGSRSPSGAGTAFRRESR
jgi:simple sugar transport system permease protein